MTVNFNTSWPRNKVSKVFAALMESATAYTAWSYGWRTETMGKWEFTMVSHFIQLRYFIEDNKSVECDFKKLEWLKRNNFQHQTGKRVLLDSVSRGVESFGFFSSLECCRCCISGSFFLDISLLYLVTDQN